jgi:metal iron transporter
MNYPSRNDETLDHPDWNQSPSSLTADLATNEDLNGIANLRENHSDGGAIEAHGTDLRPSTSGVGPGVPISKDNRLGDTSASQVIATTGPWLSFSRLDSKRCQELFIESATKAGKVVVKFARFIGPGFLIAVAYIDPGNYATDVAAGAVTEYSLLFMVLMSNCFAIFLQSLCIKLGSVTGRNLAEMCREHLPRWLTIILYVFSEAAIIATDIAEVN